MRQPRRYKGSVDGRPPLWRRGGVTKIDDMTQPQLIFRISYYFLLLGFLIYSFVFNIQFIPEGHWYTFASLGAMALVLVLTTTLIIWRLTKGYI